MAVHGHTVRFTPENISHLYLRLISIAAPERSKKDYPVSQRVDTWSLGCVFSLAATWVILGYGGIQQFQSVRNDAVKAARIEAIESNARSENPLPVAELQISSVNDDSFHDGKEVLTDVTQWHKVLRASLRKTDTITEQVLDVVDGIMFRPEADRARAKHVCNALNQIIDSFGSSTLPSETKEIQKKLIKLDELLPFVSEPILSTATQQTNSDDRKGGKERRPGPPPMKTSHRSDKKIGLPTRHSPGPALLGLQAIHEHNNTSSLESKSLRDQSEQAATSSAQPEAEASVDPSPGTIRESLKAKQFFGVPLNSISSYTRSKGVPSRNVISAYGELKRKSTNPKAEGSVNLAQHFKYRDRDVVGSAVDSDVHGRLTKIPKEISHRQWINDGKFLV